MDKIETLYWELFRYSLPLKEPLNLFGHEIFERKGLILRLGIRSNKELNNEIFGEGEIVTLPGLHSESYDLVEKQVRNYLSLGDNFSKKSKKKLFSSVNFGLDMAKRTLFNNFKNILVKPTYGKSRKYNSSIKKITKIPVNGLAIGSGSILEKECERLCEEGFKAVKIKVGKLTVKEDLKRVKLARKTLGEKVELRLDANRSWDWKEALNFFNSVKDYNIQYCEEPLRDITKIEKLYNETKVPFALDETIWNNPNPANIPLEGIRVFILKPCLLGGWDNTKLWIEYAEKKDIQVVLSSSFESGLGLNWIAYISANLIKKQFPTGLDTAKWFKKDLINPPFELKNGFYEIPDSWPKAKKNYLQYIDKGTLVTSF